MGELEPNPDNVLCLSSAVPRILQGRCKREIAAGLVKQMTSRGARSAFLLSIDEADNALRLEAHDGISTQLVPFLARLELDAPVPWTRVVGTREPSAWREPVKLSTPGASYRVELPRGIWFAQPLTARGEVVGVLVWDQAQRPAPLPTDDPPGRTQVGELLGAGLAHAIIHERMARRVEELERTLDHLQQELAREVARRRHLEETLQRVEAREHGAKGEVATHDTNAQRELERLRDEWTSVIAHDLRQPITSISWNAAALEASCELPETRRMAAHIVKATTRLGRMVGDLLDFSLLEARRLELVPRTVDFARIVTDVAERMKSEVDVKIRLALSEERVWVEGDDMRLEQIVENLLSNANKYRHTGTPVVIALEAKADTVELSVSNDGDGVPPDELARLFDRFRRSRSARAHKRDGLGLGLYITKGLVQAHGGRIWVESESEGTTTFHVSLPLRR